MYKQFIFICFCIVLKTACSCQISNGGFEQWDTLQNGNDYPLHWDALAPNADSSLSKSTLSAGGLYSVNLESHNFIDGTLGPANLGTKLKPTQHENNFTFQYLIDTIDGFSNLVVEFYQKSTYGNYIFLKSNSFNHKYNMFYEESIVVNFPSLDSVIVVFIAKNQESTFGFKGYIGVLLDQVSLTPIVSTQEINNSCHYINGSTFNKTVPINMSCSSLSRYVIYRIDGSVLTEGPLNKESIDIDIPGMYCLCLLNKSILRSSSIILIY